MSKEKKVELLGIQTAISNKTLGYAMIILRILIGWIFLQAGLDKLFSNFTSQTFLQNAINPANPFLPLFQFFATQTSWVDPLVTWSQILLGIAIIFGVFFRLSSFLGALQMGLFWIASFEGGLLAGFPVEYGFVVNSQLIYIFLLYILGSLGAGRLYGVDAWLEKTQIVENNAWLKYFLG